LDYPKNSQKNFYHLFLILLYKKVFFVILIPMEEDYKNNINPFTNQPILPGNPPFNPPGETKPPAPEQKTAKPEKPAGKFDFKIVFLYIILISLGIILAKYAFDFFAPKQPQTGSQNAANKPVHQPFIKFVPSNQKLTGGGSQTEAKKETQPLISLKKKINQAVNPYSLSGIFYSGNQSYCIINDKVLGVGDTVESAKVVRIDTGEVELQLNDKSIKLNLRGK
jgi:hypothetical protein